MGRPAILKLDIISDFNDKGMKDANKAFDGLTQKAGIAAAAVGVGMVAAGVKFAKGAAEDAAAAQKLETTLKNVTGATDANVAAVEDWISAQGRATGFTDDELRPALATLATATKDTAKAQELAASAMDLSVAKGIPLETATKAIAKAYDGNTASLGKLLPGMDKTALASKDFALVQDELNKIVGGQAAAAAGTAQGQYEILQLTLAETGESIGAALLPAIETLLPYLQKAADWAGENSDQLLILAGVVGGAAAAITAINAVMKAYQAASALVSAANLILKSDFVVNTATMVKNTAAWVANKAAMIAHKAVTFAVSAATKAYTALQWAFNAAMTANPIGLVIAAVAALVAGIIYAYKNFEPFKKLVDELWRILKNSVVSAFNAVKNAISSVVDWLRKAWDWVTRLINKLKEVKPPSLGSAFGFGGFSATPAAAPQAAPQAAGASGNVYITVQGAIDPVGTADQIRRLLEQQNIRVGRPVQSIWQTA